MMDGTVGIDPGDLSRSLRADEMIMDAEVVIGPGSAVTVAVVPQGLRPGSIVRQQVMRLAGRATARLQVVLMPAIPRLPDGSPDQEDILSREADAYRFEPPGSSLEREVVALIAQILPVQQISMTDSIGDLGGDSITAFEIAALLEERFGSTVSAYDVFSAGTLRDIVSLIDDIAVTRREHIT
jgi:acyl carrier protein